MQFTIEDYYIVATTFELWLVKGKSTCHAYTNHGLPLKQEEERVQLRGWFQERISFTGTMAGHHVSTGFVS